MAEEKEKEVVSQDNNYIETIKQLKETTVARSDYEKLQAENKELLDSIVNGSGTTEEEPKPEVKSIDDLRNDLMSCELNNLDYISTALELRKQVMANGDPDPFLPSGSKIVPTREDIECANRVADVFQECVDYAEGDSAIFTNELYRRTI